jgi:5-methylcytosine-specific restriction enzyme subunit McrC
MADICVTVEQGSVIRLFTEEIPVIKQILRRRNMSWNLLDEQQKILRIPQQYIGYIGLPNRRIIIKPKLDGLTIGHILRIYYFLYSAEYTDLDNPIYDVENGNDLNLITMFVKEFITIAHRGIPVSYEEKDGELNFAKGNLKVAETQKNILLKKKNAFVCTYDDLTRDIPINRVLLAAAKKIKTKVNSADFTFAIQQFGNVDDTDVPDYVEITRNTAYCKKALSLAYMILRELTLSTVGDSTSGESLLINFDKVFEDFIKKVLMEYSSLGKFNFWSVPKVYGRTNNADGEKERSYLPDLLYGYYEKYGKSYARAVLDMKNKISDPFHNPDVYQMVFYCEMLNCKKVILCYPSNCDKKSSILFFEDEKFYLQKIYAAYMNLAGNSARDFKENIKKFVVSIEYLL